MPNTTDEPMSTKRERHNELAPSLTRQLIEGTGGDDIEALLVAESVMLGVMLHCAPSAIHCRTYLGRMFTNVLTRHTEILDERNQAN